MGKKARIKEAHAAEAATPPPPPPLRLDLGCGPHKRDGFTGVDQYPFVGVDVVLDIGNAPWPWADGSVAEAHASHFLEHLSAAQRCHFVNELYRVLVPGGTCQIIVPHWCSNRAYGDPTHAWPPVAEMWFYYLKRAWRELNAPHTDAATWAPGFSCDFDATWGYAMRPELVPRNPEYQQMALADHKEAAQDMHAMLTKPVPPPDASK